MFCLKMLHIEFVSLTVTNGIKTIFYSMFANAHMTQYVALKLMQFANGNQFISAKKVYYKRSMSVINYKQRYRIRLGAHALPTRGHY